MAGLNLFTNNAATTLASSITNVATSLTVAAGTGSLFPTLTGSQYFYCTLANTAGTTEIVKVTARSTDTFTIVRGQDGTSAAAWNGGDKVELRLTRVDLLNFPQLDSTNDFTNTGVFSIGTNQFYKDASGNVGIGVVPSAWDIGKALEINNVGNALYGYGVSNVSITSNAYVNSGAFKYANTAAASYYSQVAGVHAWFNAPSGTAGTTATMTERMRITANGGVSFGSSGTAYGSSGQVLTSNGDAAPTWVSLSTPSGSVSNTQTFNSSGTWTKPGSGTWAVVRVWGGGGSGAAYPNSANAPSGGGGGGFQEQVFALSDLTSTVSVTIGAGGASVSSGAGNNGNIGGTTTFGSYLSTYGGGGGIPSFGGANANSTPGGGGGGSGGPGANKVGGIAAAPVSNFVFITANPVSTSTGNTTGVVTSFPAGLVANLKNGAGANANPNTGISYSASQIYSVYGGGAGGDGYGTKDNSNAASLATTGGGSQWGGGGGGAGSCNTSQVAYGSGGSSTYGGNGGNAGGSGVVTAGSQPSGGGGAGQATSSGAGGAGKCVVFVY